MNASTKNDDDTYLRSCYSYTNLFNLEPLANFRLPGAAEDPGTSSSSSLDGSQCIKEGQRRNSVDETQSDMSLKRKRTAAEGEARCDSAKRNDEDIKSEVFRITENDYRAMIGEHLKKLRKSQLRDAIVARLTFSTNRKTSNHYGSRPIAPSAVPSSFRKPPKEHTQSNGDSCLDSKSFAKHNADLLDLGEGILMEIPPFYDALAPFLHLPDFGAIQIDERILSGHLKSGAIVSMVASDPLAKLWKAQAGRGINEKSVLEATNLHDARVGQKKFPLQVIDHIPSLSNASNYSRIQRDGSEYVGETPDSSILATQQVSPITWRHILSENGVLTQCEVKVIDRCDGYEVIERKVSKKEPLKRDPAVVAKEDTEKIGKYWVNLVRKDLVKHHKNFISFHKKQLQDAKKFSECCQREVKYRGTRSLKVMKAAPMRIRKLAHDMVIFWKKADKEQAELRKKEEREAAEALKREEELREARRQQQRLNFLLTQTELYSHFMQNKLSGFPNQAVAATHLAALGESNQTGSTTKAGSDLDAIAEDAAEEAALKDEALKAAEHAVSRQRKQTDAFDNECLKLRQAADFDGKDKFPENVEDMDLLNPSTMPVTSTVQQPTCFHGHLKEYQLKGLQWLVNCYEQGLNGILADEMGLGKTIQAMAFLAHLAEEKNIWGPFLIVAPASVLNNWADEVQRFCPDLKILPYWGGLQERTVLRKNISPKRLYRRDAVFHILITSYQLLVSDEKYLRRVKWQYMVLDEAQAIKSASSIRWKTLLSFNCRNRLLLTGTPIQNNMAELWALLHFIMPTLFDSHEQFNEWFSKGIESHAEHGGTLNEHQLNRLHSILKPFMLRRVKKDVITEMTNKKEVVISCTLSSRQQDFYQAIKNKISVSDLFDSNGAHLNEKKVLNLMNIVIQLRKVCNHPELFERNDGHTFVQFAATINPLNPPAFGELDYIHYSGGRNPISFKVPKLLYRDGMKCLPTAVSGSLQGFQDKWINNLLWVFSPENVHMSIFPTGSRPSLHHSAHSGGFGFIRLIDLSPSETGFLARASILEQLLFSIKKWKTYSLEEILQEELDYMDGQKIRAISRMLMVPLRSELSCLRNKLSIGPCNEPYQALVTSHQERFMKNISVLRSVNNFMSAVQAPQIEVICSDRGFTYQKEEQLENPWVKRLLVGFARTSEFNGPAMPSETHYLIQEQETLITTQQPLLSIPYRIFGSAPPLQSFDFAKMLTDSGKLQTLDILLKRLRSENHRVLLFAQMTKMLNILEDYMNYRKYKYLRLDGSSTIMDRRDMVKDFQHRSDIFVFLLSTRAGGLGINLTAADTVIFYESDWNPTMDLQAMDRAHRLGQTKEVTVYRLICKGTVEEKIVKRANQKNTVQQLVMTGGHSQGDVFEAEEVVSLLLDDMELEQRMKEQVSKQSEKLEKRKKGWGVPAGGLKAIRLDAEGGASLEEDKISESAVDVTDASPKKSIENAGPNGKQRQGKRKNDLEGKPPKPPKVPQSVKDSKSNKASNDQALQEPRDANILNIKGRSCNSALVSQMTKDTQEHLQIQPNRSDHLTSNLSTQSGGSLTQFIEADLPTSEEFRDSGASIMRSWLIAHGEGGSQGTDISECKIVQTPTRNTRNETSNIAQRVEMEHFNVMQSLCDQELSSKDDLYSI